MSNPVVDAILAPVTNDAGDASPVVIAGVWAIIGIVIDRRVLRS